MLSSVVLTYEDSSSIILAVHNAFTNTVIFQVTKILNMKTIMSIKSPVVL